MKKSDRNLAAYYCSIFASDIDNNTFVDEIIDPSEIHLNRETWERILYQNGRITEFVNGAEAIALKAHDDAALYLPKGTPENVLWAEAEAMLRTEDASCR